MLRKISLLIFLILIITFGVTFFTRSNYRGVGNVDPEVLEQPIQTEAEDSQPIEFEREGFSYSLTPLYDYEINALIVSTYNYDVIGFYKKNSVFPIDLCLIWGANVNSKVYQNRSLGFSQDSRWCWYTYSGGVIFNEKEISNNHLVVDNDDLEKRVKGLNKGDQIKIKGKLVNVKAEKIDPEATYDPESFRWGSSTTREDTGEGACEVIYVEELEILKVGNPISNFLFQASFWGLVALIGTNLGWFLLGWKVKELIGI